MIAYLSLKLSFNMKAMPRKNECEYREIEQDSSLTAQDMLYLIQDWLSLGFALVEYQIKDSHTIWVFEK